MKILIIGPSWVGDMVMSQSLYTQLKKHYPKSQIDVLAPAWCKPILERMPEVDTAIEMPIGHGELQLFKRKKIGSQLKNSKYDRAYILPNSAKSALIPWFASIPIRTGWKGEFRYGLLNDMRPNKRVFQYMVERYVSLAFENATMRKNVNLENCPKPKLNTIKLEQLQVIKKLGLNLDKTVVGMCPGAEFGPAKRWPDKHYSEVARHIINSGHQVWLFGSEKDKAVTNKIKSALTGAQQQHCYDLAGTTSLNEAVDLLAACNTVVSNDSGLMHISAAVGSNVVAIYGSSSPKYTPPLTEHLKMVHTDIGCRPCFKRECPLGHQDCLNKLMPQKVINAIDSFIG